MDRIGSTHPSLALNAYAKTAPVAKPMGAPGVTKAAPADPIAKIGAAPRGPRPAPDPSRLVGARVEPIDLSRDVSVLPGAVPAMTSAGTYSIHPSAGERNAAATGVRIGRSLDLEG